MLMSMQGLNSVSNVQQTGFWGQNYFSNKQVGNNVLSEKSANQMNIAELARLINKAEWKAVLPTFKEIYVKFITGELDPRKTGEVSTKVQGRDDSVRIYVGKNKKGEDCVCMDYRKKHTECNIYSTAHIKIPFAKYDATIKEIQKRVIVRPL